MDLMLVAKAILGLAFMGALSGGLLVLASKRFHVDVDPRVESLFAVLPGANCGACGNPSCFGAAEAIAEGTKPITTCTAGGQRVADAVAGIMGVEGGEITAMLSRRHCGGGLKARRVYEYSGVRSCKSAAKLAGGPLACPGGCFGFGDCATVCPFDALVIDERGLPRVDDERCTGCGICVGECPRGQTHLLELVLEGEKAIVRCSSHDSAKAKRGYCPVSCIACKKCEKECPESAIVVQDFLAVVDFDKCTGCGTCVSVCPQHCIDLGVDGVAVSVAVDAEEAEPSVAAAAEQGSDAS